MPISMPTGILIISLSFHVGANFASYSHIYLIRIRELFLALFLLISNHYRGTNLDEKSGARLF